MESHIDVGRPSLDDTFCLEDSIRLEAHSGIDDNATLSESLPPPTTSPNFARIVPVNDPAKLAFHEVVEIFKADPTWNPHCQKFVWVSETKDQLRSGDSQEDDTSEGDENVQEIFTGYFRLNLALPPQNFIQGWIIGSGRAGTDHLGVDILITVKGKQNGVGGRHAHIKHHQISRLVMMAPKYGKKVWLNGDELSPDGRMLASRRMGLTIGNLAFRIEFLLEDADADTYSLQLDQVIQETGTWFAERIESIDPTPSNNHIIFHGYQIHTPQAFGAFGVVCGCVDISSGNVYAVKRVQRTRSRFDQVGDEVEILKVFEKHPHVCSLIEVIYSDGDGSSMGNKTINDVYIIIEPWAPKTFEKVIGSKEGRHVREKAYHQGAQGLRYIHSCGIIHRDIKPANLLVARMSPLRVVVADFGHSTTAVGSLDHMKGTISYLPPEIMQLKMMAKPPASKESKLQPMDPALCWTTASDVYSYGIVGYELFHGSFMRPRHHIDELVHNHLVSTLKKSRTALDEILERMLAWDPTTRPGMREVLLGPCWDEPETPFSAAKRPFEES